MHDISISSKLPGIDLITSFIEKKRLSVEIIRITRILKELEGDLKIYRTNGTMVDSLNSSISKLETEKLSNESKISNLSSDQIRIQKIIEQVNVRLSNLNELISLCADRDSLLSDKEKLKKEFDLIKDSLRLVRDKTEKISRLKGDIENLDNHINPLNDFINRMKSPKNFEGLLPLFVTKYEKVFDFDDKFSEFINREIVPIVTKRINAQTATLTEDITTLVELTLHNIKDGKVIINGREVYSFDKFYLLSLHRCIKAFLCCARCLLSWVNYLNICN